MNKFLLVLIFLVNALVFFGHNLALAQDYTDDSGKISTISSTPISTINEPQAIIITMAVLFLTFNFLFLSSLAVNKVNSDKEYQEVPSINKIGLVIIKTLDGNNIEDFLEMLLSKANTDQKSKDIGVLFCVAPNEKKMTVADWHDLESFIDDDVKSNLSIRQINTPKLVKGNYYKGIKGGLEAIVLAMNDIAAENPNPSPNDQAELANYSKSKIFKTAIVIFSIINAPILMFLIIDKFKVSKGFVAQGLCNAVIIAGSTIPIFGNVLSLAETAASLFGGIFVTIFLRKIVVSNPRIVECFAKYGRNIKVYSRNNINQSGGNTNGDNNFGGGNSGGGGASGKW